LRENPERSRAICNKITKVTGTFLQGSRTNKFGLSSFVLTGVYVKRLARERAYCLREIPSRLAAPLICL
jgi:hypothetical protein